MSRIAEDSPGRLLVLEGSEQDLRIDREAGEWTIVRHALLGNSKATTIRLDRLEGLRLRLDYSPALTGRAMLKLLGDVFRDPSRFQEEPEEYAAELPRRMRLRLFSRTDRGSLTATDLRLTVEEISDPGQALDLARKIGAAAGLLFWEVSVLPGTGAQARFEREASERLRPLPGFDPDRPHRWDAFDADEIAQELDEILENAGLPAFVPAELMSDTPVVVWKPGSLVSFRRRLSPAAFFVAPFSLMALAGPALYLAAPYFEPSLPTVAYVVTTIMGLAFGGVALLILTFLLPRRVELDWASGELRVRSLRRRDSIPFYAIERLELEAGSHHSSGGEGSSRTSYFTKLRAVLRAEPAASGAEAERRLLVETQHLDRLDEPLWQMLPLLSELSRALRVEGRCVDYPHRRVNP